MGLIDLGPGTVFARDFRIVRAIGRGGMGAVYEAQQLSTGRPRALKVMLAQMIMDARAVERFVQEAQVTARIESEHVVEVVAAGVDPETGTPWIAMELLRGETLAEHMARGVKMGPLEALEIMRQLCHAVGAAHRVGVVHRDLKPENIYLANQLREGGARVVKVLDFGIAKVLDARRTSAPATSAIGSPWWMAPEQIEAGMIRPATDVWSLGLIAFHLLTATVYWESAQRRSPGNAVLYELLTSTLEAPSARAQKYGITGAIPPGFDAWFARCVCRDANGRFRDATEALHALAVAITGIAERGSLALDDTVAATPAEAARLSGTPRPPMLARTVIPESPPQVPVLGAAAAASIVPSAPPPTQSPRAVPPGWIAAAGVAALLALGSMVALGSYAFDVLTDGGRPRESIEQGPVAAGCAMVAVSLNALTEEGETRLAQESQMMNATQQSANAAEMSGDAQGAAHGRTLADQMSAQIVRQLRGRAETYEQWAEAHSECGGGVVNEAQRRAATLRALAQRYGG